MCNGIYHSPFFVKWILSWSLSPLAPAWTGCSLLWHSCHPKTSLHHCPQLSLIPCLCWSHLLPDPMSPLFTVFSSALVNSCNSFLGAREFTFWRTLISESIFIPPSSLMDTLGIESVMYRTNLRILWRLVTWITPGTKSYIGQASVRKQKPLYLF